MVYTRAEDNAEVDGFDTTLLEDLLNRYIQIWGSNADCEYKTNHYITSLYVNQTQHKKIYTRVFQKRVLTQCRQAD